MHPADAGQALAFGLPIGDNGERGIANTRPEYNARPCEI